MNYPSDEWKDDCIKWWDRILTGEYAHWCYDWDALPIDETCKEEFECCYCNKEVIKADNLAAKQGSKE